MVAPVELVRSVLTENWSDDYAASEHCSRYWNAVSAPSDNEWPEGLAEDGDKLFLKDKLLVPENRMEKLIDHWHNSQLMHPGRDKTQQDLEWRFKFPPGYYALLDKYCSDCAVCRATKSPNHSTAGNPVFTAIPDAPMRSVAMDVFAMPEVTVEGETYDCVILAVDRHSGYIVAVPGKKCKKKDKKDKHGMGLQAKTVANAMIRHWLTFFDVPAVICNDRGSQFVGTWFKTMCKHMEIQPWGRPIATPTTPSQVGGNRDRTAPRQACQAEQGTGAGHTEGHGPRGTALPAPSAGTTRGAHATPHRGGGERTPRERERRHMKGARRDYKKGNRTQRAERTDRVEWRTSERG